MKSEEFLEVLTREFFGAENDAFSDTSLFICCHFCITDDIFQFVIRMFF